MQVDDILAFIRLVEDPKAFKTKAEELKKYNDQIKANIQLSDDVADINTAKSLAAEALNKANAQIEVAKKEAAEIVATAKTAYDKRHASLAAKEKAADEAIAARQALEVSVKARDEELRKAEKDIAKRLQQLQDNEASLASRKAEVDARLEKLKAVMG